MNKQHMATYINALENRIKELEADRLRGKWIDANGNAVPLNEDGLTKDSAWCSVCGDWLTASDEYATRGWFCPNCGADMRGKNNEQSDL